MKTKRSAKSKTRASLDSSGIKVPRILPPKIEELDRKDMGQVVELLAELMVKADASRIDPGTDERKNGKR